VKVDEYARWVLVPPRPAAPVRPSESYVVCATPRCGSWFLCGLLASTGVAGRPHEWFWRDTRASLERAWGMRNDEEYLELVLAAGTTRNGVFGAKVMFGSLPGLEPFPNPRFIWMRRRDRVAQAVSFARAVQSGHWHKWDPPPREEPEYRFDAIEALHDELEQLEHGWQAWFERKGVEPLEVVYEEVATDPAGETRRVLEHLGLATDAEIRPLTVAQQRAPEDWAERFLRARRA
jgi:trehalose 2-sulfotransferase